MFSAHETDLYPGNTLSLLHYLDLFYETFYTVRCILLHIYYSRGALDDNKSVYIRPQS